VTPRRHLAVLAAALVAGCGAHPAEPPASAAAPSTPPVADAGVGAAAISPAVFTYIEIDRSWAQKHVPSTPALLAAWTADPANASAAVPTMRHILIKVTDDAASDAAAKKKAEGILARLKRGEDFAKIARELSDDPGSKSRGGSYPGEMVEQFVEPVRDAYDALAPGETSKQPFRSQFGWHVMKKDLADEEAILAGYRRAKALDTARSVADDVAARLKAAPTARPERVLNDSITALLGSAAAGDGSPFVSRTEKEKVEVPPPTQVCAQLLGMPRGSVTVLPLAKREGFLVGLVSSATDAAVPVAEPRGVCGPNLSPATIRRLIEAAQKKQQKP
jgi:hypothetical protein